MGTNLNASVLRDMFLGGAQNLDRHKDMINDLNVFPVPDGDTGTNMTLTIMSAAGAVKAIDDLNMVTLADAMSNGSLRGARGNSGVILSQILRGISKVIKKHDEVDTVILAAAFKKASETAYKAVMQPKEGTILTIIREMSEAAEDAARNTDDIEEFFDTVHSRAKDALDRTPDMLPVLKEAGVVDSGGMGLLVILEGFIAVLKGEEISLEIPELKPRAIAPVSSEVSEKDIKFGYCTEFIIMLKEKVAKPRINELQEYLNRNGDSIVMVPDDELIKIHIHTNQPGKVITKALTYGELSNMKIDNMRQEHREMLIKNAPGSTGNSAEAAEEVPMEHKAVGFIAISAGEGFSTLFTDLGADMIIEGGQTMNPSTDDILNAVDKINADNIFVLPNNKNIILACEQAKKLSKDKNIVVIPTTTVPQGISALLSYMGSEDVEEIETSMNEAIKMVKTGSMTYAVRDTSIQDTPIHKDDYMALSDKDLLSVGTDMIKVFSEMLEKLSQDAELLTIYYGADVNEEEAEKALKVAKDLLPDKEVELAYGGQPVYYYLVSAE